MPMWAINNNCIDYLTNSSSHFHSQIHISGYMNGMNKMLQITGY